MNEITAVIAFVSFTTAILLVTLDVYGETHSPPVLSK